MKYTLHAIVLAKGTGIVLIMATHLNKITGFSDGFVHASWHTWLNRLFHVFGHYGVSLFLVASGCGLTLSYLSRNKHTWREWTIRRVIRIYTLFWISYAFFICTLVLLPRILPILPIHVIGKKEFVLTLSGLQAYVGIWGGTLNPVYWFNSLIIGLLACFPGLVLLFNRVTSYTRLLYGIGIISIISSLIVLPNSWEWFRIFPINRLFEFSFGVTTGYIIMRQGHIQLSRTWQICIAIFFSALFVLYVLIPFQLLSVLLVITSGPLLFMLFMSAKTSPNIISYLSKKSHALYLVHLPIFMLYADIHISPLLFVCIALPITLLIAHIANNISKQIEQTLNTHIS